jgi:hypothetical protein
MDRSLRGASARPARGWPAAGRQTGRRGIPWPLLAAVGLLHPAWVPSAFGQAISPPTVQVTVSASQVRPNQTASSGVVALNPAGNPAADLYVGVLLPDGQTLVFFSGAGAVGGIANLAAPALFSPTQAAPPGFSLNLPVFFQFTFPPAGIPFGTYQFFAALVRPGAFQDNRIDPGDILALGVKPLTFSP